MNKLIDLFIEDLGTVTGGNNGNGKGKPDSTRRKGEEDVTTLAIGEEDPVYTTLALGEEDEGTLL